MVKNKYWLGKKLPLATRKKMSEAHKKNPFWLGRKFSATHIKNMSESRKKMFRDGLIKPTWLGKKFSKTHRENLSIAKKLSQKLNPKKGEKAIRWNGGRIKNTNGYIWIWKPEHPFAFFNHRYMTEHRLVMEKSLGRYLRPTEVVHHINGIKDDNRIENLVLFENFSKHTSHHWRNNPHFH